MFGSQRSTLRWGAIRGGSLSGEDCFAHRGDGNDDTFAELVLSGAYGDSYPVGAQSPHRGIYLRPTVFMINGTASRLMKLYYASHPTTGCGAVGAPVEELAHPPTWWGYRSFNSPPVLVSFRYSIYTVGGEQGSAPPISEEYTDTEVVADVEALGCSPAEKCWMRKAAEDLSRSLRENRLSADGFSAELLSCGTHLGTGVVTCVLYGRTGLEGQNLGVLQAGVETALRAMRPGEDFSFILQEGRWKSPPAVYSSCCAGTVDMYNCNYYSYFTQCHFVHISLFDAIPQETVGMLPLQRYIFGTPSMRDGAMSSGFGVSPWASCGGATLFGSQGKGTFSPFYKFFRYSLRFLESVDGISEGPLGVDVKGQSEELCAARRAFYMAVISALEGCQLVRLQPKLVCDDVNSGESDCEVWSKGREGCPTHEEALLFLKNCFLATPRNGATVSFDFTRMGTLMGRESVSEVVEGLTLGERFTPLWLDMVLQSMVVGEKNVINSSHECNNDEVFHFNLVRCQQTALAVHPWEHERHLRRGCTDSCEGDLLQQSTAPSCSGFPGPICDAFATTNFDNSCCITLKGFTNKHGVESFFFVNPPLSLRTAQQLLDEVNRMCALMHCNEEAASTDCLNMSSGCCDRNEDGVECDISSDVFCAVSEVPVMVSVHPPSFGGDTFCPGANRSVVKAIHKVHFVILLLTFYVNTGDMLAKGVAPPLLREREGALLICFEKLSQLYAQLKGRSNNSLCEDALCAVSLLDVDGD